MTTKQKYHNQQGFTLIELLSGFVLFVILVSVVIGLQTILTQGSNFGMNTALTVDNANRALNLSINELRRASSSDNGAFPLETALDQTIVFYSNIDKDVEVEKVRYFLDGTDLKKGVIDPTVFPISYPTEAEVVTTVANFLRNGSDPVFYYYDENWPQDKINNPLVTPPSLSAVTLVKISVLVNAEPDQPESTMLLESSAQIRTLKQNL